MSGDARGSGGSGRRRGPRPKSISDKAIQNFLDVSDSDEDDIEELNGTRLEYNEEGMNAEDDEEEITGTGETEDVEDSDSEEEHNEVVEPPAVRRRRFRTVKSIETALDPASYDKYIQPAEKLEEKAVLVKKMRNQPEESISWVNQRPAARVGRRPAEQVRLLEGGSVIRAAKHLKKPEECFDLFLSEDILETVVEKTNKNIRKWREGIAAEELSKQHRNVTETDLVELKAVLGLLYMRGLYQQNLWLVDRLWNPQIGPSVYSATVSLNRFKFILRFVTFDDPETRNERWKTDKFTAIRSIFEIWNNNCGKHVLCGDYVAIDECLYPCRNRIGFKVLFSPVSGLISCLVISLVPSLVSCLVISLISCLVSCLVSSLVSCLVIYLVISLVYCLVSCLVSSLVSCLVSSLVSCLVSSLVSCLVIYLVI